MKLARHVYSTTSNRSRILLRHANELISAYTNPRQNRVDPKFEYESFQGRSFNQQYTLLDKLRDSDRLFQYRRTTRCSRVFVYCIVLDGILCNDDCLKTEVSGLNVGSIIWARWCETGRCRVECNACCFVLN